MKNDIIRGSTVNVVHKPSDLFNHDFVGTVIAVKPEYAFVRDQDGDVWSCDWDSVSLANEGITVEIVDDEGASYRWGNLSTDQINIILAFMEKNIGSPDTIKS